MTLKNTLQEDNEQLDACRRQLDIANATKNHEDIARLTNEINQLTTKISMLKEQQKKQLSEKAQKIVALNFNRALTKAEQADMGKLKKSVRGLMVVHPTTALGKEIGVTEVTGYAFKPF